MVDTVLNVPSVATPSVQGGVDVAQVTNPATQSTVLRENVVVADPNNFTGQAQVTFARGLMVDDQRADLLQELLIELRLISQLLVIGLNIQDDLELLRGDPYNAQRLQQ